MGILNTGMNIDIQGRLMFSVRFILQNSKKPGARLPGTSGQGEQAELLAGPLVCGAPGDGLVEEGCGPGDTAR